MRSEATPHPNHQTVYPCHDIDFSTYSPFIATVMHSVSVVAATVYFFTAIVVVMITSDLVVKLNYIIFVDQFLEVEKILFCIFLETLEAAFCDCKVFLHSVNNQYIGSLQLKSVRGVCAQ